MNMHSTTFSSSPVHTHKNQTLRPVLKLMHQPPLSKIHLCQVTDDIQLIPPGTLDYLLEWNISSMEHFHPWKFYRYFQAYIFLTNHVDSCGLL